MSNTIGLIARGKRISSSELVEGFSDGDYRILQNYSRTIYNNSKSVVAYEAVIIDPQTLQYKLGEDAWYSKAELEDVVKVKSCEWTLEDDEYDIYKTSCGSGFQFMEASTPKDNGMKYCPYCSGKIIEHTPIEGE